MDSAPRRKPQTVRWVHAVHRWTGLITGINVLILSLTGAILVFGQDLLRLCNPPAELMLTVDPHDPAPVQAVIDGLRPRHGGALPGAVFQDKHDPNKLGFVFRGPVGFYLMDKAGKVVLEPKFHRIGRFHDGLAVAVVATVARSTIPRRIHHRSRPTRAVARHRAPRRSGHNR